MGKSNSSATSASVKFTANFPSPTVISNVVRSMWNITTNTKMQGPKITITRVPTIDQSDMDYLYPIPEPEIVKSESPPESSVKMELNGFKISSSTKDCSTNTPEISNLKEETVCSKSVQTDRNAFTDTRKNGYYNGLFGNVC